MAEEVDDTRIGTITLTSPGRVPPCFAPDELGYGDIDGDGYVTAADAQLVSDHVTGVSTLTDAQLIRADVDHDGEVTIGDAQCIGRYAAEQTDTFPICWGELVEVDIPASVVQGASYDVTAKVHNKGDSNATFEVRWYTDGVLGAHKNTTLTAGSTSLDVVLPATAPTTGTSMTYDLRLVRIIAAE